MTVKKNTSAKKKSSSKKTSASGKKTVTAGSRASLSPLLRSALEVLEHSLWHFFRSETTTDMKFAIMHLDQSVELLLKEKIRKSGKSIYKNPKETINTIKSYEILEQELSVTIPEKNNLELLHEERNNIQHKYSNPTAEDASFYFEHCFPFVKRFCQDELGVDIEQHLPKEYMEQLT